MNQSVAPRRGRFNLVQLPPPEVASLVVIGKLFSAKDIAIVNDFPFDKIDKIRDLALPWCHRASITGHL